MGQKDIVSKGLLKRPLLDLAVYLLRLDLIDAELLATEDIDLERLPSYQKGLEKGLKQGLEEGAHRKALTVAAALLAMHFSLEQVAAITQLPLAEIPRKP